MRARRSLAIGAALVLASGLAGCGGGGDGLPEDLIAFVADGRLPDAFEVYVGAPGGTPRVVSGPLVPGSGCGQLAWSPDRSRLAFTSDRDDAGGADLFVLELSTGLVRNRTANFDGGVGGPSWSPDGSQLAFSSQETTPPFGTELYAVSAISGEPVLLTKLGAITDGQALSFSWRPLGGGVPQVLYRGDPEVPFRRDLYVVNVDGTGHQRVNARGPGIDPNAAVQLGQWAPNGLRLAYTFDVVPFVPRLYVWDGGASIELSGLGADPARSVESFQWSPDSTRIGFLANRTQATTVDLYVVSPTGGTPTPITAWAAGTEVSFFAWSPDGARLTYQGFTGNAAPDNYALHLVTFGAGTDVVIHPHSTIAVRWSPDGTKLAFAADGFAPGGIDESLRLYVSNLVAPATDAIADLPVDPDFDVSPAFFWGPTGEHILFSLSPPDPALNSLQLVPASEVARFDVSQPTEQTQLSSADARAWSHTGCWVASQPVVPPGDPQPLFLHGMIDGPSLDPLASLPAGTSCTGYAWR